MPVYNSENFLEEAIESVQKQTFSNWELFCIDDCSTDSSKTIIKRFSEIDKRIHFLSTTHNSGSASARNLGLREAKGTYICFLDSDDYYKPSFLESQLSFSRTKGPFVYSSYDRLFKGKMSTFSVRPITALKDIIYGSDISCLTAMYNQSILGKHFFDEKMDFNEDFAFWVSLLNKCGMAFGNSRSLAVYRIQKKSKSKHKIRLAFSLFHYFRTAMHMNLFRSAHSLLRISRYSHRKYSNL